MAIVNGTNGNDNLIGTADADTINPFLGTDTADGLDGIDILVVDYSSAPVDPFAGAAPLILPSYINSTGNSFSGILRTVDGGNSVTFSNIEHIQVNFGTYINIVFLDGAALPSGASLVLDGGQGMDTLDADLSDPLTTSGEPVCEQPGEVAHYAGARP